jgi:hypothetical protein
MSIPLLAGGTIPVSAFVSLLPGSDNQVVASGLNSPIIGIAQRNNRLMMELLPPDGNAALAGESLMVYQTGQTPGEQDETRLSKPVTEQGGPMIVAGSPFDIGTKLTSNALAQGIPATVAGQNYGAVAWGKATKVGQLVPCQVLIGQVG